MPTVTLTHQGTLTESLHGPARVALAPDGTVLVTDPPNNTIARFDAAGVYLGTWSVAEGPLGVAAHPDGRYFVSLRDSAAVAIYDNTFTFTGYLGAGVVTFVGPGDIAIANDTGVIYVVDAAGDYVYGFAADGSLVLTLGGRGGGDGQFRRPNAIAVDVAGSKLLVADQDNFRVQVFTLTGTFVTAFGNRNKYYGDGSGEGWLPRTQGLAVDSASQIFVADSMMSTVRLFSSTGVELDKLLEYGTDPGDLRTACDLALNIAAAKLYVVSANQPGVEVYGVLVQGPKVNEEIEPEPFEGSNVSEYDVLFQRDFGEMPALSNEGGARSVWNGPHIVDAPIICGRCHGIRSQPGGHEGLAEGQKALCMSCHSGSAEALGMPVHELDLASTHRFGVPAVNAGAGSLGPTPSGPLALYLDNGNMKCATCHDQHQNGNTHYLRMDNTDSTLCKDCHRGDGAPLEHGGASPSDCMTCHDPHSSSGNVGLVRTTVNGVNIVLTNDTIGVGPGAFVDPDPNVDGICEACHDYPANVPGMIPQHTLDGSMPACTQCHTHARAFEPGLNLPAGQFGAANNCGLCHTDYHADWTQTLHKVAWDNLPAFGKTNPDCLPCHTVGFGQPGGYVDQATTPHLAGVQCENCHGAAREHAVAPTTAPVPTIDRSAAMCGTCHQGEHHPTHEEWTESGHAVAAVNGTSSSTCYVCHRPEGSQGNPPVPLNVECVSCHNSHAQTGNAANPPAGRDYQLLWPEYVETVPSNTLADCQNPDRFNLCGRCHHSRSNTWQTTSRGPHYSVQANVYVGEMPVPDGVNLVPFLQSDHFGLELQCNTCHMYTDEYQQGPPEVPAITGHTWAINFEACAPCHESAEAAEILVESLQTMVQARLDGITAALGDPSTWEYSCCGGPANQGGISTEVKKARFLKKYIERDGSLGVHNGGYVLSMLEAAETLLGVTPPPLSFYVGAPTCAACHPEESALHMGHGHAYKLNKVNGGPPTYPPEAIYAGAPNPPDTVAWDAVSYVIGGFHRKARFIDQTGNIYITGPGGSTPGILTQWNLEYPPNGNTPQFVAYEASLNTTKPYNYSCFYCHTTGPQSNPGTFESWAEPAVMCEACHGPAAEHISSPPNHDILVDPSAAACGTCHTRGSNPLVVIAKGGYIDHHEQWPELLASPHDFLTCSTCHEPHSSATYSDGAAIRIACTTCHPGVTMGDHSGETFTRGSYSEDLTCMSCHMPHAGKSGSAATAAVVGPLGRMGDIKTHVFNINTDPVNYTAMFNAAGTELLRVNGEGAVTLDFVCLRCHNGIGNAFDLDLNGASVLAEDYHDNLDGFKATIPPNAQLEPKRPIRRPMPRRLVWD
jgi:predicted CXXCH cytochrome family protein